MHFQTPIHRRLLLPVFTVSVAIQIGVLAGARANETPSSTQSLDASTPTGLAVALSDLLQDAIPRSYEKKKNWNHKKRITTGLKTEEGRFNLKIHRRKREVNHGTWKHYRVQMVEPEKNMEFRIENLRSLEPGRIAFTCYFTSKLEGWAQTRSYNRGVHLITLSAEGNTTLQIWLQCEVGLALTPASALSSKTMGGMMVQPKVVDARLQLDDFHLTRISKVHGPLVRELGKGLRHLIEEELEGPKLTAKLNRAIEMKRDRLKIEPAKLFSISSDRPLTR